MIEILIFILGLIVGSFLNMLIYRLPLGISLIDPKRSVCPNCEYQLKWYENIPLFSYMFLQGKCSSCKEKIAISYPLIELVTAVIFVLLYLKFGFSYDFYITAFMISILITLSMIDVNYKAVPDYLLVIVLVSGFFMSEFSFLYCLVFAGGGVLLEFFVTFYIQNIKARITKDETLMDQKALGEGDIPIFALIGGVLGAELGVIAIFLAAIFAIIPSIINKVRNGDTELPFIPFLSLGFIAVYLNETYIVSLVEKITL